MPTPKEVERITRPTPKAREVEDEGPRGALKKKTALKAPPPTRTKNEPKRRQGKLTITQALDDEGNEDRIRSLAAVRRQREREKQRAREQLQSGQKIVREVTIPEAITVQELANRMAERGGEVVKTLMKMVFMATITQSIDADTAELVVGEFGHRSKRVSAQDVEIGLRGTDDDGALLQPR
ncbi:MAG: translation initiation factor IF-2 N-terminal domain-containing protein, partial [Tistlia sp.]